MAFFHLKYLSASKADVFNFEQKLYLSFDYSNNIHYITDINQYTWFSNGFVFKAY